MPFQTFSNDNGIRLQREEVNFPQKSTQQHPLFLLYSMYLVEIHFKSLHKSEKKEKIALKILFLLLKWNRKLFCKELIKLSDREVEIFSENHSILAKIHFKVKIEFSTKIAQRKKSKYLHESPRILFHKRIQNYWQKKKKEKCPIYNIHQLFRILFMEKMSRTTMSLRTI